MMKIIIFSFLCYSAAFTKDVPDEHKELLAQWVNITTIHMTECSAKTGVEESEIINAFETMVYPDKQSLKCYFKCAYEKLNFLNADGNFVMPMLLTLPGISESIILECIDHVANESDLCKKVYDAIVCGTYKLLT
ncbi:hypothetical protein FQA39_LY18337 [Lamprigera yunnana]|nr:hypothetical protein FQA39_LY18337 [Lamprigera yunnana]